jgi:hypothetical protein
LVISIRILIHCTLFFSPFCVQLFHTLIGSTFYVVDSRKHIVYGDSFKRVTKFVPAVYTLGVIIQYGLFRLKHHEINHIV